jgi:hypothetical protein
VAKKPTLDDVGNVLNSATTINTNNQRIEEAFDNTLSRDGSTPNQMEADLDLNNNNVLNVGSLATDALVLNGENVTTDNITSITFPNWRGDWVTSTEYSVNDFAQEGGNTYICVQTHTSGVFSTDLAAGRWELMASKGNDGADGEDGADGSFPNITELDDVVIGANTPSTGDFTNVTISGTLEVTGAVTASFTPTVNGHLANKEYVDGQVATRRTNAQNDAEFLAQSDYEPLGEGQTWQIVARTATVSYQTTTVRTTVFVAKTGTFGGSIQVSTNNATWVNVCSGTSSSVDIGIPIPPNYYYRSTTSITAAELR